MTDQERSQVLKMIESGKISPEEGLRLLQTLEKDPAEEEVKTVEAGASPSFDSSAGFASSATTEPSAADESAGRSAPEPDPAIKRLAEKGRALWYIPLVIGILITVFGGLIMYWNVQPSNISGWFYCLGLPVLLLGVVIITAAVSSRQARWLFVDVHQKPGERPQRIFLGLPLPLRLTAWFFRTFGDKIPDLKDKKLEQVIEVVETGFSSDSPLTVNVDEGEDGARVQVYLG